MYQNIQMSIGSNERKKEIAMSGDIGLKNEPVIFYSEKMTMAKLILLSHKGIPISLYNKTIEKLNKYEQKEIL